MDRRSACIVGLGLAVLGLAGCDGPMEKSEVDGTWKLVRFNKNGEDNPARVKEGYVVVRENGIQTTTKGGESVKKLRYALHSANPRMISFFDLASDERVSVGIYEVTGDTMKLAVLSDDVLAASTRPDDFTEAESRTVIVYKRMTANDGGNSSPTSPGKS